MTVIDLSAKICMAHLLLKPTFHQYSFIEGEVTTFNKFHIDGRIHKEFFDEKPEGEYSSWKEVQDFSSFLSERGLSLRPDEIQGLYLNFRYDGSNLQCVTGVSTNSFTMDKTLEQEWDVYAKKILAMCI